MPKGLLKIKVETLPNGYSLEVNDESYMYFNEVDLLAGIMSHVGLHQSKPMEQGSILSGLFSVMMGEEYANAVTTLKQRVGLLSSRYETTLEKMDSSVEYVTSASKQIDGFKYQLEKLSDVIKGINEYTEEVKAAVKKAEHKVSELNQKSKKVEESLANSATIMKAIKETGSKNKKNDSDPSPEDNQQGGSSAGEETAAQKEPDKLSEVPSKRKGARGLRDEKIIEAIRKRAESNPNLK